MGTGAGGRLDRPAARVLRDGLAVLGRAIVAQPRVFVIGAMGGIGFGLLTVGGAGVVGVVIGRVVIPAFDAGHVEIGALAAGGAAIMALSLLKIAAIFARRLGAGAMQFRLQAEYRRQVTHQYLRLAPAWHRRHPAGELLSNANSDVEALWGPIAPLPFAVGTLVMLVGAIAALLAIDWTFAVVGLAIFPILLILNVFYSRSMAGRVASAQALRAQVSAIAHESFDGALLVKTLGLHQQETDRFAERADHLRDAMIRVGRVRALFDPLLEGLPSLGTLAALLVGVARVRQGAVSTADVVSAAYLFTVLAFPVRAIGWVLADMPRSAIGWRRVDTVLSATDEVAYGETRLAGTQPSQVGRGASLAMTGVDFAYQPGTPVLGGVGLDIPAGRTLALVGPTGSGKSTLASLAARLVDPDAGLVSIDGVDVRTLRADELAGTVSLVAQVPFVFDDTVRANITLDRPGIDDTAVWSALARCQADGFVRQLPDGLDTMVGERGTTLSGGQRQRLTLARALVGRPRLLILDDATSAVDPRIEAAIVSELRDNDAACTVLLIAYRRATIALADEVAFLDGGKVRARGTHQDLLSTVPEYAAVVAAYERADAERERTQRYDDERARMTDRTAS